MDAVAAQFGPWEVACLPDDGARLRMLRYAGHDLLTPPPARYLPPAGDCGEYETRPVYGYDDCFPSVDPSDVPGCSGARIRDHGELCWVPWRVTRGDRELVCAVRAVVAGVPVRFVRTLRFAAARLTWGFAVRNEGAASLPFLHVMHALLPLAEVAELALPGFAAVVDEMAGGLLPLDSAGVCARHLLRLPRGQAAMWLLHGVRAGRFAITFRSGVRLEVTYDAAVFPTLGVWWNHAGYPGGEATRRVECAVEPIPGAWSSLSRSWRAGGGLEIVPGAEQRWKITWSLSRLPAVG